jgi:hypothetical protein
MTTLPAGSLDTGPLLVCKDLLNFWDKTRPKLALMSFNLLQTNLTAHFANQLIDDKKLR